MIFSPLDMYQHLMDTLPLSIVIYRPTVDGKDFIFMDINDKVEQTDKISKSEVIGKRLSELFPRAKEFGLYDVLCRVYKTGNPEVLEPTLYQDDRIQGWRRNEVRLLPNGDLLVMYEDYTERKKLETDFDVNLEELIQKTHLLEHYKETIDKNTIVSMTDKNGYITYISEAFEKISGYTKKEVIGKTHALFRHPDTRKSFYTNMWNTLKDEEVWEGEIKNRRKNGGAYWLRLHIEYDKDHMGNFIGYSATGHDITHKIHLEALTKELEYRVATEVERNRLQTIQMLEQSRLAQMGEMISMIAHQWRQPLASIAAISSKLTIDSMMDNYKKEFFGERLETISDLSQHLSATIDDFRSFFKENKVKEDATWEMITEKSLSIIEPTLQAHNIRVERLYENKESLHTYMNEVRQVLLNIFKNAEDIFLEKKIDNATIWVRSYQKEGMTCLSITDNAGGIPEELLTKIFDPYFSTKEKKDGTGLGLYMSRIIIEEHCKGKLTAHNIHKGACFEIMLPI